MSSSLFFLDADLNDVGALIVYIREIERERKKKERKDLGRDPNGTDTRTIDSPPQKGQQLPSCWNFPSSPSRSHADPSLDAIRYATYGLRAEIRMALRLSMIQDQSRVAVV